MSVFPNVGGGRHRRAGEGPCPLRPLPATLCRSAAIVLISCGLGLAVNAFHPMGLPISLGGVEGPGIPRWVWHRVRAVYPNEAHVLWERRSVIFLDVRDRKDYGDGHIPRAISLPYQEFTTAYPQVRDRLPQGAAILIYCYGSHCGLAMRVAKLLLPLGYADLTVMRGGIAGWEAARYETTAAPRGWTRPAASGSRGGIRG